MAYLSGLRVKSLSSECYSTTFLCMFAGLGALGRSSLHIDNEVTFYQSCILLRLGKSLSIIMHVLVQDNAATNKNNKIEIKFMANATQQP